jgi:hypothetical protein
MNTKIEDMRFSPFSRLSWHGKLFTTDGADTTDFTKEDVDDVLWYYDDGDRWEGMAAGLVKLKDGRIISWETSYGPTGDGFNEDAYGGDADILCSKTVNTALLHGFTPGCRHFASQAPGVIALVGLDWLTKI